MTTYLLLGNWTDSGIRSVTDSPRRLDAVRKMIGEMGGELKAFFMTMGEYDFVVLYEAPDDAVAARFTLMLGKQGNLRSKTLKAFPETAYREIINSLT
jgi:uncharacterized protein with GYD domain